MLYLFLEDYVCNDYTITIIIHLELSKFKYISNYMLIYVKIFKLSDCLDILYADT